MNELLKALDRVYQGIQHLNIQATRENTAIVLDAIQTIEAAHAYIRNHPDKEEGGENE